MHICYPYGIGDFVETTSKYAAEYTPDLTIIHSTVVPGTTRSISERSHGVVAYSPVRGKHTQMEQDILNYTKYVAGLSDDDTSAAAGHLERASKRTEAVNSPETLEIVKLIETTYFGLLVAWAQDGRGSAKCQGSIAEKR